MRGDDRVAFIRSGPKRKCLKPKCHESTLTSSEFIIIKSLSELSHCGFVSKIDDAKLHRMCKHLKQNVYCKKYPYPTMLVKWTFVHPLITLQKRFTYHIPYRSHFWVDDFPIFPFGGIWIHCLEGTPPETNSSHLKMDGRKMHVPLGSGLFSGSSCVHGPFPPLIYLHFPLGLAWLTHLRPGGFWQRFWQRWWRKVQSGNVVGWISACVVLGWILWGGLKRGHTLDNY